MLTRGDVGMFLGLGGLLLGAGGAYFGFRADRRVADFDGTIAHDGEMIETLASKVEELRKDVQAANTRISSVANELEQRRKGDEALRKRLDEIEAKLPK